MARSTLFQGIRQALQIAAIAGQAGAPPIDELADGLVLRRRTMVRGLAATLAGAAFPLRMAIARQDARIAVVGAGLAGLVAAHRLVKAGARAVTIFEANSRLGGRMFSLRGHLGPGVIAELGGSFINSDHQDIIDLCDEFGLQREDGKADIAERGATYFIAGRHRSIRDIAQEAAGLVTRLQTLKSNPPDNDQAGKTEQDVDRRSAAEWLDRFGCRGWLRTLLDVGLTPEMGLEPDRMSGLYLLESFTPDPHMPGKGLFGSDQRYQIAGGNDRLPAALATALEPRIRRGCRLEAIRMRGRSASLTFAQHGRVLEVSADIVVLALPASILRGVEMRIDAPPRTMRAIRELTYGTNAKLFAGLTQRPWRANDLTGECLNDLGIQTVWEDHPHKDGDSGSLTIFAGGRTGVGFGNGQAVARAKDALLRINPAFPGVSAAFNGRASAMYWPGNPFVHGSYSCFAPGQMTGFKDAFGPAGPIVFAGEHTSPEFSGYMNGAAESGRMAAETVATMLA